MRALLITVGSFLMGVFAIVAGAAAVTGSPAMTSRTVSMTYDACLEILAEAAEEAGSAPVLLSDAANERSIRIEAADGHVTIACRKVDDTLTLTAATRSATKLANNPR
jgi:hypothetical protein